MITVTICKLRNYVRVYIYIFMYMFVNITLYIISFYRIVTMRNKNITI